MRDPQWNVFLEELAICGNVTEACQKSNISRSIAYRHRDEDEEFAKAWTAAETLGVDGLIDEAKRRAYAGVDKPVYHQGRKIDTLKEYSDELLRFLIRAKRPEYRDKSVEVNVTMDLAGRVKRAKERTGS